MIDLNELRRLAQAANAEPNGDVLDWVEGLNRFRQELYPDDVLELLDRLEAAEKDRDTLHAHRTTLQHMVYSLKDQLKGAGKELDTCKAALEEWHQKTGWVHQGVNDGSIPPTYLGWHRADVMADMLKSARGDYCVLESHYTALADELAFAKKK